MSLRLLFPIIVLAACALAFAACSSSDDKSSDGGGGQTPAAEDDTSDGGATDEGDEPADDSGGGANSRGSGTAVIGDETFEFDVDTCVIEDMSQGGSVIIGGPSTTADGQPAYVDIEYHRGGVSAVPSAQVAVGVDNLFDINLGSSDYNGSAEGDFVAEINGGAHIEFTSTNFFDRASDSIDYFDGSVDVTCE